MKQELESPKFKVESVTHQVNKYRIKVRGTSPLILDTRQRDIDEEKKKVKKSELDEWEQKNWHRKAETDSKGNVIIPSRWFRSTFINACKVMRFVPHYATRKNETYTRYAESLVFDNSTFKCLPKKLKSWGAYVKPQGGSSQIYCIRPRIEEWETEFEILDSQGRMREDEMQEILEYAGSILGVGTARKLNFGRFEVVSIKNIK